jgi:hypothetical protein
MSSLPKWVVGDMSVAAEAGAGSMREDGNDVRFARAETEEAGNN